MATKRKQSAAVAKARKERHREISRGAILELAGKSARARLMVDAPSFTSVPSRLVGVNRAFTTGGLPLGCVYLVHGPEAGGKTAFTLAIIDAVQKAGGIGLFVDAEQSAETKRWFAALNFDMSRCIYIGRVGNDQIVDPFTYEQAVEEVDGFLDRYDAMRKRGDIRPDLPVAIIVDSVSSLAPANILKKLAKEGASALRAGIGREQAMMNRAWLMELEAKIGSSNVLFAAISHETDKDNPGGYGVDYDVRGGKSLKYSAMMRTRVTFAGQVFDLAPGDGERGVLVGKRHRVEVLKNKHGPAMQRADFYLSTGAGLAPAGFDRPREVLHEALVQGRIEGPSPFKSGFRLTLGSSFVFEGRKFPLRAAYEKPEIIDLVEHIARSLEAKP